VLDLDSRWNCSERTQADVGLQEVTDGLALPEVQQHRSKESLAGTPGRRFRVDTRTRLRGVIVGEGGLRCSEGAPSAEFREWRLPDHTSGPPSQLLHHVAESVYQHGIALPGVPARLSLDRCCCTSGNASPSCHLLQPHIGLSPF